MPTHTNKDVRNKLSCQLLGEKIEASNIVIDSQLVWDSLQNKQASAISCPEVDHCFNLWVQIIINQDVAAIKDLALDDSDWANTMRAVSPLKVLLSEGERLDILQKVREQQTV